MTNAKKFFITALIACCAQHSNASESTFDKNGEPKSSALNTKTDSQPVRPDLSCKRRTGALLCNRMESLIDLFDYECRGAPCYELFNSQRAELDALTYAINYLLEDDTPVSLDLYKKAHRLSKEICITEVIGEPRAISKLILSMNSALRALKQIQSQLNVPADGDTDHGIYTCRMKAGN